MGELEGKVAIITGAGQGIGKGLATVFAKEGAAVVCTGRTLDTVAATADDIRKSGGRALALVCDGSKREEVNAAVAAAVKEFGTIDICVNNAQARQLHLLVEDVTDEDLELSLGSGLYATLYFMQAVFPYMKERGGKIINVGTACGPLGMAGMAALVANKDAIRALTRVAANEWGKYRINCNSFCPGSRSPGYDEWERDFPEQARALLAQIPMGRVGDPEQDIAPAVLFLASSKSDYITGQTLMIDGGFYKLG